MAGPLRMPAFSTAWCWRRLGQRALSWAAGWRIDGTASSRVAVPFLAAAGFTALGIAPAFISTLVADAHLSLALIAVLVLCTSAPWGVAVSALQQFTPNEMRGQVSAIYLFFVNIIGIGMGPTLIALVTDHGFGDDAMLRYAMSLVAGASAILAVVTLALGLPAFRSSLQRAEAWRDA